MDQGQRDKTVSSYRDINLSVQDNEGSELGFIAGGKFKNCVDLAHLTNMFSEKNDGSERTVLCFEKYGYYLRDLIHNYNVKECLYITTSGHFTLIGFHDFARLIEVIEDLMYFVDIQ